MNQNLINFKNNINGKKVAVIGIGVSNTPLIKFLHSCGAYVIACDRQTKDKFNNLDELEKYVDEFSFGDEHLNNLDNANYIFRTPGMRYDKPELIDAQKNGAIITSETELFLELCPCKIIGITGSDGKTTTSTLISMLLKAANHKVWLGGNIGTPLIEYIEEITENDIAVLELSSFQLHTFKKSPDISVITNISPNHLDYHLSYDEYIDAKKNIFKSQNNKKLVLNYDNEITKSFMSEANGEVLYFSRINDIEDGILVKDNHIVSRLNGIDTIIINTDDIKIPGKHNVENYMAAIAATQGMVSIDDIISVATTFEGVEHRIEFVREIDGVKFYNDSIGTSPTRTNASIKSFKQKVILIAGGYDKKLPFDELGVVINEHVKSLYLVGKTSDKIEESVKTINKDFPVVKCSTFEETVKAAFEGAIKGDIVLLSPACASFDMFKDFAERGRVFKLIVNSL